MASFARDRLQILLDVSNLPTSQRSALMELLTVSETGLAFLQDVEALVDMRIDPRDRQSRTWPAEIERIYDLLQENDPDKEVFKNALITINAMQNPLITNAIAAALVNHAAIGQAPSNFDLSRYVVNLRDVTQACYRHIVNVHTGDLTMLSRQLESIRADGAKTIPLRTAAGLAKQMIDSVAGSYAKNTIRKLQAALLAIQDGDI